MKIIEACPICGGVLMPDVRQFPSAPVYPVHFDGIEFRGCALVNYAQCTGCTAYVQSLRMDDDHIESYYSRGIYRSSLGMTQEHWDKDEELRAVATANALSELMPIESHLDIGSSRGFFLMRVNANAQVGIEPNVEYNRNEKAHVTPKPLDLFGEFDMVSFNAQLQEPTPARQFADRSAGILTNHEPLPRFTSGRRFNRSTSRVAAQAQWFSPSAPLYVKSR